MVAPGSCWEVLEEQHNWDLKEPHNRWEEQGAIEEQMGNFPTEAVDMVEPGVEVVQYMLNWELAVVVVAECKVATLELGLGGG